MSEANVEKTVKRKDGRKISTRVVRARCPGPNAVPIIQPEGPRRGGHPGHYASTPVHATYICIHACISLYIYIYSIINTYAYMYTHMSHVCMHACVTYVCILYLYIDPYYLYLDLYLFRVSYSSSASALASMPASASVLVLDSASPLVLLRTSVCVSLRFSIRIPIETPLDRKTKNK